MLRGQGNQTTVRKISGIVFVSGLWLGSLLFTVSQAQSGSTKISGDLTQGSITEVSPPTDRGTYEITGGFRAGTNLFHSFKSFSVGTGNTAKFSNAPDQPATTNIVSRVTTGGLPSEIHGTIQANTSSGFPDVNFFLFNPAGMLFGPGANLDVEGSVHVSTANYLRFQNGKFFADPTKDSCIACLTTASVEAFGFMKNRQGSGVPAPIEVNSTTLKVESGKSLSLVGGDIKVVNSNLTALSGHINLASVSSDGEVLLNSSNESIDLNMSAFNSLGRITISSSSEINVNTDTLSDQGNGTVEIRGGVFLIDQSFVNANNTSTKVLDGATTGIDIRVKGKVEIRNNAVLAANASGSAFSSQRPNAADINIEAKEMFVDNATVEAVVTNAGDAGDIIVNVERLSLKNGASINNNTTGPGSIPGFPLVPSGSGGKVEVNANESVTISGEESKISSFSAGQAGSAGRIIIETSALEISNGGLLQTTSTGSGNAGKIEVTAESVAISDASILAQTSDVGEGGIVDIDTTILSLDNGIITTRTQGANNAGTVRIKTASATLTGTARIESSTTDTGDAGNVTINAKTGETLGLSLSGGARITTTTSGTGDGGNVSITANGGEVTITGADTDGSPSSITTESIANNRNSGVAGNAGSIIVDVGRVVVQDRGKISATTETTGQGGNVTINATEILLTDGGSISAESTSTNPDAGASGNIDITSSDTLRIFNDSSISVETKQATAGDINLTVGSLIHLKDNGRITTSASGGTGDGGNINIDPDFVILEGGSRITAQAKEGSGGNINIVTGFLFQSPDSVIDASSETGIDGNINIDSPDTDTIPGTVQLPSNLLNAAALMSEPCFAKQLSNSSSLVIADRNGIAPTPDNVLSSRIDFPSHQDPASQTSADNSPTLKSNDSSEHQQVSALEASPFANYIVSSNSPDTPCNSL